MDTITHSLLGGLVTRSLFPKTKPHVPLTNHQRIAIGAIGGAFPDIDYIASWIDPMVYLTQWHRGITHSLVLLPIWSIMLGILLAILFRQRGYWRYISLLVGTAILSHILSDLITVYGTQIFAPLSHWRASFGTTFIIDPWFTLLALAGFAFSFSSKWKKLPVFFLATLVTYVLLQGIVKHRATAIADDYISRHHINAAEAIALPQPFSPFNWKLVVREQRRYDVAYVNLAGPYSVTADEKGFWARVKRTYRDTGNVDWQVFYRYGDDPAFANTVRAVWHDAQLNYFRQFADMPFLYRIDQDTDQEPAPGNDMTETEGTTDTGYHPPECIWFADLRFVLPYMPTPFRYGLCRKDPGNTWQLYHLDWEGNAIPH